LRRVLIELVPPEAPTEEVTHLRTALGGSGSVGGKGHCQRKRRTYRKRKKEGISLGGRSKAKGPVLAALNLVRRKAAAQPGTVSKCKKAKDHPEKGRRQPKQ